jgi:hypothetical protein
VNWMNVWVEKPDKVETIMERNWLEVTYWERSRSERELLSPHCVVAHEGGKKKEKDEK